MLRRVHLGRQVEEAPPAGVLDLGERVRAEQVAPRGEPDPLGRVLLVREVVGALSAAVTPARPMML